jgi:uncharacterized MAPEG superfamily protein
MSVELLCLVASAILCLALPLFYVALYNKQVGFAGVSGTRENIPEPTGAAGRGRRAHHNLIENLVPFTIAVIAAHFAGVSNSITVYGAVIFLGARIVHAVTYILGIPVIRTLAYFASLIGTAMIFAELLF